MAEVVEVEVHAATSPLSSKSSGSSRWMAARSRGVRNAARPTAASAVRRSLGRTLRSAMPSKGKSDEASAGRRATRSAIWRSAARRDLPPRCTPSRIVTHTWRSVSASKIDSRSLR